MSATDDRTPARGPAGLFGGVVLAAVFLALGYLAGSNGVRLWTTPPAADADAARAAEEALVRSGDMIIVPEGSPYRSRIQVAEVRPTTAVPRRVLPAMVEADPARTVNVLPPLGGHVVSLDVHLGDAVAAGQHLATISSGDLAQAYADDDKAAAQLRMTRLALDRARSLLAGQGAAMRDVESAQNDFAQADAEYKRTQARLKALGAVARPDGSRDIVVRAPVAGVVTSLATAPGTYVNDPTVPLLTLSNLDTVWVTANVPENDVGFVSKGQEADVTFLAWPGQTFHGTVSFVGAVLEPDTRRDKVRIAFANPDLRLKPNMFATVTFLGRPETILRVPTSALLVDNDATTVFEETAPWTFVRRSVVLGPDQDDAAPVLSGLRPGARIIVRGGVLLND